MSNLPAITGSGKMTASEILSQQKPFFSRPEGKSFGRWGLVASAAAVVGAITVGQFLGFWALLFTGTMWMLKAGGALLGAFLLAGILTSDKAKLLYQLVCWHLHNKLIKTLDMEVRYNFALEQQQGIITSCTQKKGGLRGAIEKIVAAIKENVEAINNHKALIR